MSENNIDSDKTSFKVRLSGEDYHDIVIDWKDTKRPYKQQVFRQLSEIAGIPLQYTSRLMFIKESLGPWHEYYFFNNIENGLLDYWDYHDTAFDRENIIEMVDGNEHFGLAFSLYCDVIKHFYICYSIVPERLITATDCSSHFCHYTDTRDHLNKLKAIINNDVLHSQMKALLVHPRYLDSNGERVFNGGFNVSDEWFNIFRQYNIMQYYRKPCYLVHQEDRHFHQFVDYMPPQLYLRARG